MDPGSYILTAETTGFKKYIRDGLQPRIRERLELNIVLELGAVTEEITVTGEAPLLETTTADLSQAVDNRYLDKLYMPSRNPLNLLTLTPGVVYGNTTFGSTQGSGLTINGGGSSEGSNEVIIDGVSVVMPRQRGAISNTPSADGLSEFKVLATMFDASLGRSNGGAVIMASKGGTNDYHGSFEAFFRDKVLEANSWTNNKSGKERPETDRTFVLGTVGGPIVKNKTFFFASYQRERLSSALSHQSRVPSELERNGDFSQTLNGKGSALSIYDPLTTIVEGSKATRDPFAGNVIPSSRFDPTGKSIIDVYPLPNQNVPVQIGRDNFVTAGVSPRLGWQFTGRVDQMLRDRQRLFGRFGYINNESKVGDPVPAGMRIWTGQFRKFYSSSINHDITFSPTTLATFRYGWVRYWNDQFFDANFRDPKELNVPNIILSNSLNEAWPYVSMSEGIETLGGRVKRRANDVFSIVPSLTKLMGSHNLRFGADLRYTRWNSNEVGSNGAGRFDFRNQFTRSDPFSSSSGKTSGTSMASLLLGTLQDNSILNGSSPYSMNSIYTSFFIQDDWKVTPKLTLNFGLRYEIETPYKERYNRMWYGFDRDGQFPIAVPGMNLRGGGLFAGVDGRGAREGDTDYNNFSPRFGFAYRLFENTVIRGGYGLFYSSNIYNTTNSTPIPRSYGLQAPMIGSVDGHATPFATVQNPFPNGITPPPGNAEGMAARAGNSIRFMNQTRILPYNQQWQLSVQQQLSPTISMEVAFLRTLSINTIGDATDAFTRFDLNETADVYRQFGAEENKKVPNPFYGIFGPTTPLGASKTLRQRDLWRQYPQFTSVQSTENGKTAYYHALIIKLEKRFSNGLSLLFNHNWSKMIENNRVSLVNPRPFYRGISGLDRPHMTNVAIVYDLPFGRGRPFLEGAGRGLDMLVGGWTVSGRFNYRTGTPLGISDSNGRPIRIRDPHIGGSIHDRLGDQKDASGAVVNPYFDITAFESLPTQYTISPEAPFYAGEIRQPQRTQLDMAVMKSFNVWRERVRVVVRGEAQNFTNTPEFGSVGTDMASLGSFGVVRSGGNPRIVQFGVRAEF
ncbi:MAG: TonB-dependent receptor [bacterium]|nr:TonB-dependent receptor [bacterium]